MESDLDRLTNALHAAHEKTLNIVCADGRWEIRPQLGSPGVRVVLWWIGNDCQCMQIELKSHKPLEDLGRALRSHSLPKSDEQRAMEQCEDALHKRVEESK